MKKIGIIGGLGPEATIQYYKLIIEGLRQKKGDRFDFPEIIIYSVSLSKLRTYFEVKNYADSIVYLVDKVNQLKHAGAEFAVMSANTPHLLFDEIEDKVDLPMISIVESCAQNAKTLGIKKCGLIGTKFTMQNDFYFKVFERYGIQLTVPESTIIQRINSMIFDELTLGIIKEETHSELLEIIAEMKEKHHIEALILGCTEFALIFKEAAYLSLPFLNTTQIHVDAIVAECLKE